MFTNPHNDLLKIYLRRFNIPKCTFRINVNKYILVISIIGFRRLGNRTGREHKMKDICFNFGQFSCLSHFIVAKFGTIIIAPESISKVWSQNVNKYSSIKTVYVFTVFSSISLVYTTWVA